MKTAALRYLADQALAAFWRVVLDHYPETTTGDLSPGCTVQLQLAAESAIQEWISNNADEPTGGQSPSSNFRIENIECHRNGICGAPFHVVIFNGAEEGRMVGIVFEQEHHVAVLNVDLLAVGNITFGVNSWRGDHYERRLRNSIDLVLEMEG